MTIQSKFENSKISYAKKLIRKGMSCSFSDGQTIKAFIDAEFYCEKYGRQFEEGKRKSKLSHLEKKAKCLKELARRCEASHVEFVKENYESRVRQAKLRRAYGLPSISIF